VDKWRHTERSQHLHSAASRRQVLEAGQAQLEWQHNCYKVCFEIEPSTTCLILGIHRLALAAERSAEDFKPQEIANTLWALATAGVRVRESLVDVLTKRAERTAGDFNPQSIANTLWALTTLKALATGRSAVITLCELILSLPCNVNVFTKVALQQLHQFFVCLQYEHGDATFLTEALSTKLQPLAQVCRKTFIEASRAECTPSQLQQEVARVIRKELGATSVLEEQVLAGEPGRREGGGYSVDILLIGDTVRAVVEVDGPTHFVGLGKQKREGRVNGSTALKRRLLRAMGWRVVSVPYYEWDPLTSSEQKLSYVRSLLQQAPP
jgi:hypothetical protein